MNHGAQIGNIAGKDFGRETDGHVLRRYENKGIVEQFHARQAFGAPYGGGGTLLGRSISSEFLP